MARRIYVYAISKNEAAFARRWMASMAEADGVFVLDTGSTDGTAELLRSLGADVETEVIAPWRFDEARNRSLARVPADADLCVCTDLDEVFRPGWRAGFESALDTGAQRLRYRYVWSYLPDGREGVVFLSDKAHPRRGWRWVGAVHEVLRCEGAEPPTAVAEGVQLDHLPDPAKSRGQYLPLLELAVAEEPENDRNMHYLGREYLFHRRWRECEETLLRHLALPTAVWRDERCASMRYLARAVLAQGRPLDAESWLLRAAAEAPWLREPWLDYSALAAERGDWGGSLWAAERALAVTERRLTYLTDSESWGAKPHDLAAVAAYNLGAWQTALAHGRAALNLAPEDARLKQNLVFYEEKAK